MYGPQDVSGECNAKLYLGDDFGDNVCTVRCQLPIEHSSPHKEEFQRSDKPVTITWFVDEEEKD